MTMTEQGLPADDTQEFSSLRFILYHKSPTSARTQFLLQGDGVCLPDHVPKLAQLLESGRKKPDGEKVLMHPSPLLRHLSQWLAIPGDALELDGEFCERVDVPGGPLTIYLARFTDIDPPAAAVSRVGARFIALTDGRGLPPAELDLLRRAYSVIMED